MRRFLLLILLFASPALADRRTEEIAVIAASAADIITTKIWLHHDPYMVDGVEHFPTEGGPILGQLSSPVARIAVKAGGTAGILWLARFVEGKGHDRAASFIRLTGVSVWSGAAGWNLSLSIRY